MSTAEKPIPPLWDIVAAVARDDDNLIARLDICRFMVARWHIPLLCAALYLFFVRFGPALLAPGTRAARLAHWPFAGWNLALSLFSTWGAFHLMSWELQHWAATSWFNTICGYPFDFPSSNKRPVLALLLFCLSKIPELGDTLFLVAKGKPIRFLQWYHHVTVMLYCWLALATEFTPGLWFAATNYCVHAVMYMYFFLMAFGSLRPVLRTVAPLVTVLQITQMVFGLVINGSAVFYYFSGERCHVQPLAVYSAVCLYGSYLALFSALFVRSFCREKPDASKPKRA